MAENVDLVRHSLAHFNAEGLESIIHLFADDFEGIVPPSLSAEPDVYRGPNGARRWVAGWDGMEGVRFEVDDLTEVDDGVVAVSARLIARGVESGIEVEQPNGLLFRLRAGRLHRIESFPTFEEALAAANG